MRSDRSADRLRVDRAPGPVRRSRSRVAYRWAARAPAKARRRRSCGLGEHAAPGQGAGYRFGSKAEPRTSPTPSIRHQRGVTRLLSCSWCCPCIEGRLFDDARPTLRRRSSLSMSSRAGATSGRNAVGQDLLDPRGERLKIVGVVRSGGYRTLQQAPQPTVYYPSTQDYLWRGHLLMRTDVGSGPAR